MDGWIDGRMEGWVGGWIVFCCGECEKGLTGTLV